MSTPPFPYQRPDVNVPVGMPVIFDPTLTPADLRNIHFGEVGLRNGHLVTSGAYGWTLVATGIRIGRLSRRSRAPTSWRHASLFPMLHFNRHRGTARLGRPLPPEAARDVRRGLMALMRTRSTNMSGQQGVCKNSGCGVDDEGDGRGMAARGRDNGPAPSIPNCLSDVSTNQSWSRNTKGVAVVEGPPMP